MENFTFQNLAAAAATGQHVIGQPQIVGQNIIQWPPQAVPHTAQTQVLILAQQNPAVYVGPNGQIFTTDSVRQQQQWINCFPTTSQAVVDTTRDPWQVAQAAVDVAASEAQQYTTVTQSGAQITHTTMADMNQMYTESELEAQAVAETLNHLRNQQIVHTTHADSPGQNSYGSNNTNPDPEPEASGEGGDWITIKIDPTKNQKGAQNSAKENSKKKDKGAAVKMETLVSAQMPMQQLSVPTILQQVVSGVQTSVIQMPTDIVTVSAPPLHQQPTLSAMPHSVKMESTVQTIDIELMETLDGNAATAITDPPAKKKKKRKKADKEKTEETAAEKKAKKGGTDSKAGCHKCVECGALFAWARNLNRHMRKHTGVRPYACESCDATFTQNSHLKVHRLKHTGERPFVCQTCQASFTRSSYLNRHMLKHTESAIIPTPTKTKKKKNKGNAETRTDAEAAEQGLTTINFPDALSGDVLAQPNGMKDGSPAKKKKKKNKEAGTQSAQYQTTTEGALNLVKQEAGVGGGVQQTLVAAAAPQPKAAVSRHTGQRHECKICKATFLLVSSLTRHMLKHSGDKVEVHTCKQCSEVFPQADHLQRHMLKHAGERRHVCCVCAQSFAKSSHLTKHVAIEHPAKPKVEQEPTDS